MTESQWLACGDPEPMLEALGRRASGRKLRLFACACARRTAELFPDDKCLQAVEVAERYADDRAGGAEQVEAVREVRERESAARLRAHRAEAAHSKNRSAASAGALALAQTVYMATLGAVEGVELVYRVSKLGGCSAVAVGCHAANGAYRGGADDRFAKVVQSRAIADERAAQADLLRDLFTDQFRPVVPDHNWFTTDVMALAGAIYDGRAFDQMPILADALQDAGCDSADVLNHCREVREHVRGCWVLDLVLGKA